MIEPSRAQEPTTAMIYARMLAREALAAEPIAAAEILEQSVFSPENAEPDLQILQFNIDRGLRHWIVTFKTADSRISSYDGEKWQHRNIA